VGAGARLPRVARDMAEGFAQAGGGGYRGGCDTMLGRGRGQ
jgi:hypothetical protein